MRVLMLSWEYPPNLVGGIGEHVLHLVPALAKRGIEVEVLTPLLRESESMETTTEGVVVHRVGMPPEALVGDFFTRVWQANNRMRMVMEGLWDSGGGFDLIHAHDWLVSFAANALKWSHKAPLLATIHATERGRTMGSDLQNNMQKEIHSAEWRLSYEAWRIIACSDYMREEVANTFNVPPEKIDVVPNGVQIDDFVPASDLDVESFRAMYALPDERIIFFIGRLVKEKGIHVLLEAAPKVLAACPKAKFVVAGHGPMLEEMRRRAWEIGVGEKVLFTGYISDEERNMLYSLASCAVFPSLYEPFGIVALEAMAARCPVVVSETGGLKEVVTHERTGITVYPDDPDSLAWGITHTLQNPDTAGQVDRAYNFVETFFSWGCVAVETIGIYRRIVSERQGVEW